MHSGDASGTTPAVAHTPLQGIRVLLADDSAASRGLLTLQLQRAGASVTAVDDGRELVLALADGTDAAATLHAPPAFDLVLTDIEMPELDGYAATGLLRALGCTLPVVALTAHNSADDRERSRRAGCNAHVGKPVDLTQLLGTCCRLASRPDSAVAEASAPPPLLSQFADDPEMRELVESFTATLPQRAESLETLHRDGQLAELARLAHQLKGVGGGYGFPSITEAARAVDVQARSGEASPALAQSLKQLVTLCRAAAATPPGHSAQAAS